MDTVAFLKTSDLITNHLARKAEIALLERLRRLDGAKEKPRRVFGNVRFRGLSGRSGTPARMSPYSHEASLRYWMGTIRYVKSGAVIARKALLRVASAARLGLAADRRGPVT